MTNKLRILINTVLFGLLLSSCKPLSLHMIGDRGLTEHADDNPTDNKESELEN
jgi:hypothetical protein